VISVINDMSAMTLSRSSLSFITSYMIPSDDSGQTLPHFTVAATLTEA